MLFTNNLEKKRRKCDVRIHDAVILWQMKIIYKYHQYLKFRSLWVLRQDKSSPCHMWEITDTSMFPLAGPNVYKEKWPGLQLYLHIFVLGRSNFIHTYNFFSHWIVYFANTSSAFQPIGYAHCHVLLCFVFHFLIRDNFTNECALGVRLVVFSCS